MNAAVMPAAPELSNDTLRVVGREAVTESELHKVAVAFLKSLGDGNATPLHAVVSDETEIGGGEVALLSVAWTESYLADRQAEELAQKNRGNIPLRISREGYAAAKAAQGSRHADSAEIYFAARAVAVGTEQNFGDHCHHLAAVPNGEDNVRAFSILLLLSNGITSLPRRK